MRTPPRLDQLNLLAGHRQLHCPHTDHLDLLGAYAHGLAADLGGRGSAVQRRPDTRSDSAGNFFRKSDTGVFDRQFGRSDREL